jgi:hypothetical protein
VILAPPYTLGEDLLDEIVALLDVALATVLAP